jgi:hypothetical protein
MRQHTFIFTPGTWQGEGKIALNMVEEELFFHTQWTVLEKDFANKILCIQDIKIQGLSDQTRNELSFYNFQNDTFTVDMENSNLGRIVGKGVRNEQTIAWEFRNTETGFEGYESYTLQSDGSYLMKGEYVTGDQFRTVIDAKISLINKEIPKTDKKRENEEES